MVYMFKVLNSIKSMFEWSEEFNIMDLDNRIVYLGDLLSYNFYMELEFKEIKCEDGGCYMCLFNGLNLNGNVI